MRVLSSVRVGGVCFRFVRFAFSICSIEAGAGFWGVDSYRTLGEGAELTDGFGVELAEAGFGDVEEAHDFAGWEFVVVKESDKLAEARTETHEGTAQVLGEVALFEDLVGVCGVVEGVGEGERVGVVGEGCVEAFGVGEGEGLEYFALAVVGDVELVQECVFGWG